MNRNYLKHEFLITARSRRTIPFVFFITILVFSYCFILWPYANTKEAFKQTETEEYLTYLENQQNLWESIGNTGLVFNRKSINVYFQIGNPVYANKCP